MLSFLVFSVSLCPRLSIGVMHMLKLIQMFETSLYYGFYMSVTLWHMNSSFSAGFQEAAVKSQAKPQAILLFALEFLVLSQRLRLGLCSYRTGFVTTDLFHIVIGFRFM